MTGVQIFLIGIAWIAFVGVIGFILALVRYFMTPIVGEITINTKVEEDIDCIYNMNIDIHPATWKGKSVRFRVIKK